MKRPSVPDSLAELEFVEKLKAVVKLARARFDRRADAEVGRSKYENAVIVAKRAVPRSFFGNIAAETAGTPIHVSAITGFLLESTETDPTGVVFACVKYDVATPYDTLTALVVLSFDIPKPPLAVQRYPRSKAVAIGTGALSSKHLPE